MKNKNFKLISIIIGLLGLFIAFSFMLTLCDDEPDTGSTTPTPTPDDDDVYQTKNMPSRFSLDMPTSVSTQTSDASGSRVYYEVPPYCNNNATFAELAGLMVKDLEQQRIEVEINFIAFDKAIDDNDIFTTLESQSEVYFDEVIISFSQSMVNRMEALGEYAASLIPPAGYDLSLDECLFAKLTDDPDGYDYAIYEGTSMDSEVYNATDIKTNYTMLIKWSADNNLVEVDYQIRYIDVEANFTFDETTDEMYYKSTFYETGTTTMMQETEIWAEACDISDSCLFMYGQFQSPNYDMNDVFTVLFDDDGGFAHDYFPDATEGMGRAVDETYTGEFYMNGTRYDEWNAISSAYEWSDWFWCDSIPEPGADFTTYDDTYTYYIPEADYYTGP